MNYIGMTTYNTFQERLDYLRLTKTFHDIYDDRGIKQSFYRTNEWRKVRERVIYRDDGCELGLKHLKLYIKSKIIVHHIMPITAEDIIKHSNLLFDLNNLVCVSKNVHEIIHYNLEYPEYVERKMNDTIPWR